MPLLRNWGKARLRASVQRRPGGRGRLRKHMAAFSLEQWRALSPYLDQALEISPEARAAWLDSIREQNPALATELGILLKEHHALGDEGFLQGQAQFRGPGSLTGQTVGAYTLETPIGQGGMGTVWLARRSDGRYQGRAAVKFLNIALVGGAGEERFRREGTFLARLAHPNIAHLIDAGVSASGQPYLILEYVEGDHIDRYCNQRALDVEARIRLFLDVMAAVAQAHANLIVHRDIKPSNVLVTSAGHVKLLDFGIAKLLEDQAPEVAATGLTGEGGKALTLAYAAPEQVTGGSVTTGTDVYALGVLLHQLLAGKHPVESVLHSPAELIKAIVETEPQRPSDAVVSTPKLRPALRGDLDTIVIKALRKNPAQRYASVTAFADDLRRYLAHETISARPDALAYRARKFVRRNRVPVAAAALVIAFGLVLAAVGLWSVRRVVTERNRAEARSRQLTLMQARTSLESNPTASLAWLKTYPKDAPDWDMVRDIAADAPSRGIASHVLPGSDKVVTPALFSPDGTIFATGSGGGIRLYDAASGRERSLLPTTGETSTMAFSPDGHWLAASGQTGSIELFSIAGGVRRSLAGHTGRVRWIAWSPDGKSFASSALDNSIRLWDAKSGAGTTLTTKEWLVDAVAFSPDGKLLASAGGDGTVKLWDLSQGSTRVLRGHQDRVHRVVFSPDGSRLASLSEDKTVRLWTIGTGESRVLSGHEDDSFALAFSPDGRHIASGSWDRTVRVWDVESDRSTILRGHEDRVHTVAFSPDGAWLASAGRDSTIRVWELATSRSQG